MAAGFPLTRRERATVAALADAMAAPVPPLPAVEQTDTVEAFAAWLAAAPAVNRTTLRAGLRTLELAPFALGHRQPLSKLDRTTRSEALRRIEQSRLTPLRQLVRALSSVILISYYGNADIMRLLGYDADANVERGRELIAREGRVA